MNVHEASAHTSMLRSDGVASSRLRGAAHSHSRHWGGPVVGGFYLSMGGVHLGVVGADPQTYQHFADAGLFALVRDGWQDVFMAQPAVFGLLLAAGEIALGILLLLGGRCATIGWTGVVAFHVLLMLFGFGIWLWCIPALAALIYMAHKDRTTIWPDYLASRSTVGSERP